MILLFRAENADNAEGKEVKSKRIRGFLLFPFPFFSAFSALSVLNSSSPSSSFFFLLPGKIGIIVIPLDFLPPFPSFRVIMTNVLVKY